MSTHKIYIKYPVKIDSIAAENIIFVKDDKYSVIHKYKKSYTIFKSSSIKIVVEANNEDIGIAGYIKKKEVI